MAEPFLGEIRLVGFNFAPQGWALCDGQLLSISQNTALFALLGTFYGGNGVNTFALPDLRGRVPIHQGQGVGLSPYVIGEVLGAENITLNQNEIPAHSHNANASSSNATKTTPIGNYPATQPAISVANLCYGTSSNGTMNPGMIAPTGGSQPHENRQPSLVLNWIIALQGIFPTRN